MKALRRVGVTMMGAALLLALVTDGTAQQRKAQRPKRRPNAAMAKIKDDPALPHDNIFKLIKEDSGTLLIGTLSGLVRYDGTSTTTLNDFSEIDYWLSPLSMDVGMDGTFWVATTSGLVYSSDDGATWTTLTIEDGLSTNQITYVLVDKYGTVWVGGGYTYGGGGLLRIVL